MFIALPPIQATPPAALVAIEPWRPEVLKATLPLRRLEMPQSARATRGSAQRSGEATVEVTAPGLSEELVSRLQLKLSLTAAARDAFRLAGPGSLEGRMMLATFSSFDATNIQGLANAQTKQLQDLFNPPQVRPTWGVWSLGVQAEPRR